MERERERSGSGRGTAHREFLDATRQGAGRWGAMKSPAARLVTERPSAKARRLWRAARSFQAGVQRALLPRGVTFMEWLMLETIDELNAESCDQVTQSSIAARSGVSPAVISYWVTTMSEYGAVARVEHDDPRAWGVVLTDGGQRQLAECNERLEAAGLTR